MVILGILVFLSGIFPALRASRSNPIESLRYE
jgi:ABC-type antimicrobial peptide transport system permease subunit